MNLIHYTYKPLEFDPLRTYEQSDNWKPVGFWLSAEGDGMFSWKNWCTREEFGVCGLENAARFVLAPNANVLHINNTEELDAFNNRYGSVLAHMAKDYDGIIIAPYHWQRRNELIWYYSWDCASGCIWNLQAIQFVWHLNGQFGVASWRCEGCRVVKREGIWA
jgi:hypothetical protein